MYIQISCMYSKRVKMDPRSDKTEDVQSQYKFTLVKAAKKSGGDKYECGEWVIYFPQNISRTVDGIPSNVISMQVTADDLTEESPSVYKFPVYTVSTQ